MEEVTDSRPETLSQQHDVDGLDKVQGEWELDELVNDLQKEWCEHDGKKVTLTIQADSPSKHIIITEEKRDVLKQQQQPILELVAQLLGHKAIAPARQKHKSQVVVPCNT